MGYSRKQFEASGLDEADWQKCFHRHQQAYIRLKLSCVMHSDLQHIPRAIRLSRANVRTVRQNLFWAFIYNVIGIPIAAGALYPVWGFLLDPMLAGAAMALSSVSVVTNSLRLKRARV